MVCASAQTLEQRDREAVTARRMLQRSRAIARESSDTEQAVAGRKARGEFHPAPSSKFEPFAGARLEPAPRSAAEYGPSLYYMLKAWELPPGSELFPFADVLGRAGARARAA